MPKQYTILGRPVPRFTPRRIVMLLCSLSLFALCLIAIFTSAVPSRSLTVYNHKIPIPQVPKLPKLPESVSKSKYNPFHQPAHPPPRQKNDEFIGSSWWADWKWLSVPFSNSVTHDDDRALLPHLKQRQPIYCYYDATIKKTKEEKDAESDLLLVWRRAWWARGFRPIILGPAEAMKNPMYRELQTRDVKPNVRLDLMRWLAWDTMGAGLLSRHLLFPMGVEYNLLPFLRRGEFPSLIRWDTLGDALLASNKADLSSAIRAVLSSAKLATTETALDNVPKNLFLIESRPPSLAYYHQDVVKKKYAKVMEGKEPERQLGPKLNQLINAHLQTAWQNSFPEGIEILKPFPEHTSAMVQNAVKLAQSLASCAQSPMPGSCPPNLADCGACGATTPMIITTPARYHDSKSRFTIGTVPHPWTLAVLNNMRDDFNVSWVRENAPRDGWLSTVTQEILGSGLSSTRRVLRFKEDIAGEMVSSRSLWVSAEREFPTDLDWYFGFAIPKESMDIGKSKPPVPGDRIPQKEKPDRANGPPASQENINKELPLLERAREVVAMKKSTAQTRVRASLEAWNMADTEAWKFTRALQARRKLERSLWEGEESKYAQGAGSERGRSSWNRWNDRKEESG